jgi:hypothetical protein
MSTIPATGSLIPLHPRLREHGMTRDANGRLVGSLRAGLELLNLTIDLMTPEEKALVRKTLEKL